MMDFSHVIGEDCLYPADSKYQPKYYKGEDVAVAQSYKDAQWEPDTFQQIYVKKPTIFPDLDKYSTLCGWVVDLFL